MKIIGDKKGQKGVPFCITQTIKDFLNEKFPLPCNAYFIAKNIKAKESTVRRTLCRLAKKKNSDLRRYDRGFYIAIINKDNFGKLECPSPKMHNITFQFEPIETKKEGRPPALNTKETNEKQSQINKPFYWNWDDHPYKVIFQLNQNNTITVHLNASKKPIDQIGYRDFYNWVQGVFAGLELHIERYKAKIASAELNLDYKLVTFTPKTLTIRDLQEKSFFRLYKKYSNLTRIEVGTTFEGEKAIYKLFIDFVKPAFQELKKDDFKDVV